MLFLLIIRTRRGCHVVSGHGLGRVIRLVGGWPVPVRGGAEPSRPARRPDTRLRKLALAAGLPTEQGRRLLIWGWTEEVQEVGSRTRVFVSPGIRIRDWES